MHVVARQIKHMVSSTSLPPEEFSELFDSVTTSIGCILKFKGRDGGECGIRKAREIAKRPNLMHWLRELSQSPLFESFWTPNMFRTLATWDLTVRNLRQMMSCTTQ